MSRLSRGFVYLKIHGVRYTVRRFWEKFAEQTLGTYERQWQRMAAGEEELARQRKNQPDAGLISVVIPVYNTQPRLLKELAASLCAQTYDRWEACLYDASTREETRSALRECMQMDERIHVQLGTENDGISGNTNRAIAMAKGQWIALCDHDDLLTPDALWRVAEAAVLEGADLIYTDEDKVTEDGRLHTDPHCKPDFGPDNLRASNYICHLMAIRHDLLDRVGGLRSEFDGSQDHDLVLRCSEQAEHIAHVPVICYHWRTVGSSVSHQHLEKCLEAARKATEEHIARMGCPGRVTVEHSVLRIRYQVPERLTTQVIVTGENSVACHAAAERLRELRWPHAEVVEAPSSAEGRWQAMNTAAAKSKAEVLLFVDAEVSDFSPDFLTELLMYAQRDDVGVVTPALLNRNGRLTHAGYVVGPDGLCACRNRGMKLAAGGWHLMAIQSHNVSAVSPACLVIRRDHYVPIEERGGTVPTLAAWCLALQAKGLRHVYTPQATAECTKKALLHSGEAVDLSALEREGILPPDWHDPCWNPRLDARRADYSLTK